MEATKNEKIEVKQKSANKINSVEQKYIWSNVGKLGHISFICEYKKKNCAIYMVFIEFFFTS